MKKIPFSIAYRPQVESGEYRVVTREDRPVEIKIWDLKGDFPIVGVYYDEKNNRDTAVQVTVDGRCSIKPDDDYCDDFFIITSKSEITEFRKELTTMVDYAVNHAKSGVNVVDIFADRIFEYAKLEFEKDMPKWRKSQNFEQHKDIHKIVIRDGKMFASSTKEIGEWFLDLSELEKLTKEEINKNKKTQELFSIARKEVEKDLAKV